VRLHRDRVRLWRDAVCVADHPRAPDGAGRRVVDPAHFAPLFPRKPRAQAMLYREVLLGLGGRAPAFLAALSRRQRARLREELLALHALHERHDADELPAAMALADDAGAYSADALALLLAAPRHATPPAPALLLPGVPPQSAVDRLLSAYEALVRVDIALPEVASWAPDLPPSSRRSNSPRRRRSSRRGSRVRPTRSWATPTSSRGCSRRN